MNEVKKLWADYGELLFLCVMGVATGAIVAIFEVIFGLGLLWMDEACKGLMPWICMATPAIGVLILWIFRKYAGPVKKGMNLIFEVSQGKPESIPKRTVALVTGATWLSHLAGASVGREGVAIQIGAAVSYTIGKFFKPWMKVKNAKTIFLVTGMAAGFAGLFGTPFTAVLFAMEVLVAGVLKFRAMAPAICAALTASWVSGKLSLKPEILHIAKVTVFDLSEQWWQLIVLGVLCGIIGGLFAGCLRRVRNRVTKLIPDSYKRMIIGGIVLGVLVFVTDCRYSFGGGNLIFAPFTGGTIYWYDFLMKFAFTIFSLAIGFIGGEVTPLFAIGVCLGTVVGPLIGLDPQLCAALCYAAVFGAGTNTWLAPIMVGMEIFGYSWFPFFFCVCSCAYLVNRNASIYSLQQRAGLNDV